MIQIIEKIIEGEILNQKESSAFIHAIENENIATEHIVTVLACIQFRGIQLPEIIGFREALLELSNTLQLNTENAIDLCGTGGDGKNTFNISTTTSLVLAAMGKNVIKHGNYGVSSNCGSSNVLEALGFEFTTNEKKFEEHLKNTNFCFLHAPNFHPTLKKVSEIRKNLGVRTIFNSLGPLVNPCQPKFQMTGTYSLELAKIYQHVLRDVRTNFKVIHSLDGYDEFTMTDATRILGVNSDQTRTSNDYLEQAIIPSTLLGGNTIQESAIIVKNILAGKGSRDQNTVIAGNVAEALHCFDDSIIKLEAYQEANQFILSGQAAKHFNLN